MITHYVWHHDLARYTACGMWVEGQLCVLRLSQVTCVGCLESELYNDDLAAAMEKTFELDNLRTRYLGNWGW